jgi:DNA repair protein RAD16
MEMNNVPKKLISKKGAARAGTLVVCPLIALSQWKAEIEKFTEPDIISVGIYHGPNRASEMPEKMLQKYDVVLTTYQVLEADFRKMVSPNKVTCPNCGGKFKIDKLHVHLKYFCGENAQRTEAQARQRRTADRRRGGQSGGNRTKKKPPMTKTFEEKAPPKKKKEIRLSHTVDYDSDSELSIDEVAMRAARPSRSAAQSASKKLSASVKEWGASNPFSRSSKSDSDEETSYASDPESSEESGAFDDDSSSEEESLVDLGSKKRKAVPVKAASEKAKSYESQALKRAREKQQKALEAAKMSGKGGLGKGKKSGKKAMAKKSGKGKREDKKFDSSSDDDSFDNEDDDPMAGIDLNELMEEAMEGSQRSVLHSFTWWRIVLDEAHFIKVSVQKCTSLDLGTSFSRAVSSLNSPDRVRRLLLLPRSRGSTGGV